MNNNLIICNMKYFLDTEFHEYHKQPSILGLGIDKAIPTIDLISIGIVSEGYIVNRSMTKNGEPNSILYPSRIYYAISKDFNVTDAWWANQGTLKDPNFWLRENVLTSIYDELVNMFIKDHNRIEEFSIFNMRNFKTLLRLYGKTNKEIAEEIKSFTMCKPSCSVENCNIDPSKCNSPHIEENIEFYAYYADYDWVVLSQLFGTMMNLPRHFPMYCRDLKQVMDEAVWSIIERGETHEQGLEWMRSQTDYPKQDNEHNALADAKWNKDLYKFLQKQNDYEK